MGPLWQLREWLPGLGMPETRREHYEKRRTMKMGQDESLLEPIDPQKLYPLPVFQRAAGQGRAALRKARDSGLKVHYAGGRGWVLGQDWIDHVVRTGKTS